jgi:dipeptidase D
MRNISDLSERSMSPPSAHFPSEPHVLENYFHAITQLPRPLRQEEEIREFILHEAERFELQYGTDEVGNVIVYVPGSPGYEDHEAVII